MKKLFSIPYGGQDPQSYIKLLEKYTDNIHSIFFGLYYVLPNHLFSCIAASHSKEVVSDFTASTNRYLELESKTFELTQLINNHPSPKIRNIKKYITLNLQTYQIKEAELSYIVKSRLVPTVQSMNIHGAIIADFRLASIIHDVLPYFEIQTSCNAFQFSPRVMDIWHHEFGTTVFNPPREILRNKKLLDTLSATGYDLKCIINENCIFGCPMNINHSALTGGVTDGPSEESLIYCDNRKASHMLRGNYILPKHVDKFVDKVKIFKIAGRARHTIQSLQYMIEVWINGDDRVEINLNDILEGRNGRSFLPTNISRKFDEKYGDQTKLVWPITMIPDYIFECGCERCEKGCKVCEKTFRNILDYNNIKDFPEEWI